MRIIIIAFFLFFSSSVAWGEGDVLGGKDCNSGRNSSIDRHAKTASKSSIKSNREAVRKSLGTQ